MYRITHGSTNNLPDVTAFIEALNRPALHPVAQARNFFNSTAGLTVTRAPGRLDVMGGIADYSGSFVLQLPIAEAALVALQRDSSRMIRILSLPTEADGPALEFNMPLADFTSGHNPIDYETARLYFQHNPTHHWAAYIAGAFLVLVRERNVTFTEGARILIASNVPPGKGVSSSAALEAAVMQAIVAAFNLSLEPLEIALLCQKVENLVVGAPCGAMDQITSICGAAHRLLALECQPATLEGTLAIPEQISFWGLDSGIRHSVSGSDYASARVGAFMGYRIIADLAGLNVKRETSSAAIQIEDDKWAGYLANLSPSEFEQHFAAQLPERMLGGEFLAAYQGATDAVTKIEAGQSYQVRLPTAHPIYENFRVRAFAELLGGELSEAKLRLLGELMFQSHASYSACGLGAKETDFLVSLARAAGPAKGIYGAKITGGGSGGTVAVLGRQGAAEAVQAIAHQYAEATGYRPRVFQGSSPGAAHFGYLSLEETLEATGK